VIQTGNLKSEVQVKIVNSAIKSYPLYAFGIVVSQAEFVPSTSRALIPNISEQVYAKVSMEKNVRANEV
jgi:hypothetical protein